MTTLPSESNPFATRYVRPGALAYRFPDDRDPPDHDATDRDASIANSGLTEATTARLVDMTKQLNQHRVGLIVGPHGSGKTTLLQTWLPMLRRYFPDLHSIPLHGNPSHGGHIGSPRRSIDRWRRAKQIARQADGLRRGGLLILDGAEQLGIWNFHALARQTRKRRQVLLATTHHRMFIGSVLHRTTITPQLVTDLTQHLILAAPRPIQRIVEQQFNTAWLRHPNNVRELFFELYDSVQDHLLHPASLNRATRTNNPATTAKVR